MVRFFPFSLSPAMSPPPQQRAPSTAAPPSVDAPPRRQRGRLSGAIHSSAAVPSPPCPVALPLSPCTAALPTGPPSVSLPGGGPPSISLPGASPRLPLPDASPRRPLPGASPRHRWEAEGAGSSMRDPRFVAGRASGSGHGPGGGRSSLAPHQDATMSSPWWPLLPRYTLPSWSDDEPRPARGWWTERPRPPRLSGEAPHRAPFCSAPLRPAIPSSPVKPASPASSRPCRLQCEEEERLRAWHVGPISKWGDFSKSYSSSTKRTFNHSTAALPKLLFQKSHHTTTFQKSQPNQTHHKSARWLWEKSTA
jgi:hypothetical protein